MDDNKTSKEQLPEDFRPVIPEPEKHRRAILQFSKNYPVEESPTSTHTLSFAQEEARRKAYSAASYVLLLILVFIVTFVITDTCIQISKEPIPETTSAVQQVQEEITQPE
ncbi:MAG: hypothetical protein IKC20_06370 [Clostridia bacterium]|nr:hypothetical protein [Clostridia bacterium]MBR4050810.1 hypothetical protein [Clostridia bacterium]